MTKKCIVCNSEKELIEFYAHSKMSDGHLNKCKECCKRQAKSREETLRNNSEWCEKERLRSIEKYNRLNYKEKQFKQKKLKTYINGRYKNLNRNLNLSSTENAHHWNYNLIDDVIILDKKFHRYLHRFLMLNDSLLIFETIDGNILDSKDKHLEFINTIKIIYNK